MRRFQVGPREVTLAPQEKPTLVGRLVRRFVVAVLAWAMARTDAPLRPALDRAFAGRSEMWRDEVFKDAWKRMVSRTRDRVA